LNGLRTIRDTSLARPKGRECGILVSPCPCYSRVVFCVLPRQPCVILRFSANPARTRRRQEPFHYQRILDTGRGSGRNPKMEGIFASLTHPWRRDGGYLRRATKAILIVSTFPFVDADHSSPCVSFDKAAVQAGPIPVYEDHHLSRNGLAIRKSLPEIDKPLRNSRHGLRPGNGDRTSGGQRATTRHDRRRRTVRRCGHLTRGV
jgi:hypothetical protein